MNTFPVGFFTFDFCFVSLSSSPIAIKGLKQVMISQLKQIKKLHYRQKKEVCIMLMKFIFLACLQF